MNDEHPVLRTDRSHATRRGADEMRVVTPQAQRALAEATARRDAEYAAETKQATEVSGRGGLEPVRYGDWEIKGIASDF